MFSGADAPWHWVILGIVVIALFGYKRLPDAARSLGRSMRIFKTEIKGMTSDDDARDSNTALAQAPAQTAVAGPAAATTAATSAPPQPSPAPFNATTSAAQNVAAQDSRSSGAASAGGHPTTPGTV